MTLFEYYMIKPAVDFGDHVESFFGDLVYNPETGGDTFTPDSACMEAKAYAGDLPVFWTIYGYTTEGPPIAIGDFVSFEAAYEVLQAMLVPIRRAIDKGSWSDLEDMLNQSTNEVRL